MDSKNSLNNTKSLKRGFTHMESWLRERHSTIMDSAQSYLTNDNVDQVEMPTIKEEKLVYRKTNSTAYLALLKRSLEMLQILGLIAQGQNAKHSQIHSIDQNTLELITTIKHIDAIKHNLDRFFIEQLLAVAIKDLQRKNGISKFKNLLELHFDEEKKQQKILEDNKTINSRLRKLSSDVTNGKIEWKRKIEDASEKLGLVKDLYEDTLFEDEIKGRYINQWEAARQDQGQLQFTFKERKEQKNLKQLRCQHVNEEIVHDQIKAFNAVKESDYWKQIEYWRKKYDEDMEEIVLQIRKISGNIDRQKEEFTRISNIYNFRENEIKAYLILREKRRQEAELYQRKGNAATGIQAWWRGVMVRHGLGPYRKKKGKKGGKNNADKEVKKKK